VQPDAPIVSSILRDGVWSRLESAPPRRADGDNHS
jgi:hypothetical protein